MPPYYIGWPQRCCLVFSKPQDTAGLPQDADELVNLVELTRRGIHSHLLTAEIYSFDG